MQKKSSEDSTHMRTTIDPCSDKLHSIMKAISTVIVGKDETVQLVVLSLISGGHVLIEDIPGVGKTSLVSALSRAVSCRFQRIQFTPDIMPSDITGFSIFNQKTGEFEFRPGAAMSNFVLADEINRASPKAQASLLEVMEERQITVDSHTYVLEEPFMVLATQNPLDNVGTYPLPEAQIDRFQIRVSLGYPCLEEEMCIMAMKGNEKKELKAVATGADILELKAAAADIQVQPPVVRYIASMVAATRKHTSVLLGASPRGSIALYRMSQALVLCEGRNYVIPDDVKYLAPSVLAHRLILTHEAKLAKLTQEEIVHDVITRTEVPVGGALRCPR